MKENELLIKIDEMLHQDSHPTFQDLLRECCPSTNSTATIVRALGKLKHDFNRKIKYDQENKCYSYEEEYPYLSPSDF